MRNTYWNDRLLERQRTLAGVWPQAPSWAGVRETLVGTRAEVRQRGGIVPAWVLLTLIMLGGALLCTSSIARTRGAMAQARIRYETEAQKVEQLRQETQVLQKQVQRLQKDPAAVAEAAHQYGMIRANEKVVTLKD